MKFLIDAQLPRRLASQLERAGHDALHTLDLPQGNRTPDEEILALGATDHRVLITKDADFVDSLLIANRPDKLLLVSTGNIRNTQLLDLVEKNLATIVAAFSDARFVELSRTNVIVHL